MLSKKVKKILMIGMVTLLSFSSVSCSKNNVESSKTGDQATELNIYMVGEFKNIDKVIEKFEEETKDTLNIKLNIKTNTSADHKEKLPLMLATGEDIDLVFDAYWLNLSKMVSEGVYADLTSYFNNPEYPGLQQAFSEEYLEANAVDGVTYAVPFTQYAEDLRGIYIRKDLREKYNLDEINNLDEFEEYLKVLLENETDLEAPFGITGRRGFQQFDNDYEGRDNRSVGISGTPFTVRLSEDEKSIVSITMMGDDESYFAANEAPYNIDLAADRLVNRIPRWMPYVQEDSHVQDDAYNNLFKVGKVAAVESTIANFAKYQKEIQESIPGADVEFFPYYQGQLEMQEGAISMATQTAWNFLCVPQESENKDEAMAFLNWIFESQENHDLFEFGIEGDDWEAVGENEYEKLNSSKPYEIAGYELTWNPNFVRVETNLPEYIKEYLVYSTAESSYSQNPLSGFVFNTVPVKNEVAAISSVISKYETQLICGILGDKTAATIEVYHDELIAAGADTVREEVRKQVEEFLSKK